MLILGSTKPVQCNSQTAFQRGPWANIENVLVGELFFIEEPVFRKEEPAQLAVAANSGSSCSWNSLIWASGIPVTPSFCFLKWNFKRRALCCSHKRKTQITPRKWTFWKQQKSSFGRASSHLSFSRVPHSSKLALASFLHCVPLQDWLFSRISPGCLKGNRSSFYSSLTNCPKVSL